MTPAFCCLFFGGRWPAVTTEFPPDMSTSPPDEGPPVSADASHRAGPPEGEPAASLPIGSGMETAAGTPPAEDLPEWEPLTPELVEDDAIRGDFAMRWVVVGLAMLLGCSQIAETKTLIHI